MNLEKIVQDLTSGELNRLRKSGLEVIENSQNEKAIESLIPHLSQIKRSPPDQELGGVFWPNIRFYFFPIEIIEFYKRRKSFWRRNTKCSCALYLSDSYRHFNPVKQAENDHVELVVHLKGNWTQDYEIKCLKCQQNFYVSEKHHHAIWWHWEKLKHPTEIPRSGILKIDREFLLLNKVVREAIARKNINLDALIYEKERILNFRKKLASDKETVKQEISYAWNKIIDTIINDIELLITNQKNL